MNSSILIIRNLTKKFGAVVASDNISLQLQKNEIHALIGPNGAGKSTLIEQIAGRIKPDHGVISLQNNNLKNFDEVSRARLGIARSFQVSSIISTFTAIENIMLACLSRHSKTFDFFTAVRKDKNLRTESEQYLEMVNLKEKAYVTATNLSHGEKRKLELGIALALNPKIFLFDEPTAGLGAEEIENIMRLFTILKTKAPILLVEHDMDVVFNLADRISVLVYGKIIATGSPFDIRQNLAVREAYLGDYGL